MIYLNSHASDWRNEAQGPIWTGTSEGPAGVEAMDRVKLLKLLWDAVARSSVAATNCTSATIPATARRSSSDRADLRGTRRDGAAQGVRRPCMSEYDVDGWKMPGFFDGDDLTITQTG